MRVCARPVQGRKGMVELLVDGKVVPGVFCKEGSARICGSQIEFTAVVSVPSFREKETKKEEAVPSEDKH